MCTTIESETNAAAADAQPKPKRTAKRAKVAKKGARAKESGSQQKAASRNNKKAEVIALLKHAEGSTVVEIVKPTG